MIETNRMEAAESNQQINMIDPTKKIIFQIIQLIILCQLRNGSRGSSPGLSSSAALWLTPFFKAEILS